MLTLMFIMLVVALSLAVILYVGGLFLQGYFYTVPSEGLRWQAPAAAAGLTAFLLLWCVLVAQSGVTGPQDVPYDTLFRFSPRVDLVKEPLPAFQAKKKDGAVVHYQRKRTQFGYEYKDTKMERPWNGQNVVAIVFGYEGEQFVMQAVKAERGGYRQFQDEKTGYTMTEYEGGPTGIPSAFRWGRFLMNLTLNLAHLILWFVMLWLVLRFQWSHALGLALAIWLLITLAILPLLLTYAAEVAARGG